MYKSLTDGDINIKLNDANLKTLEKQRFLIIIIIKT